MINVAVIYSGLLFSTSGVVVSGSGTPVIGTGEIGHLFNYLTSDYENNDRYANWAALMAPEKSDAESHMKRASSREDGEDSQARKKLRNSSSESDSSVPTESSEDSSSSAGKRWDLYGRLGKLRARAEALATSSSLLSSEGIENSGPAAKPMKGVTTRELKMGIFDSIMSRYRNWDSTVGSLYEKYKEDLEKEHPEMRPIKLRCFRSKATELFRGDKTEKRRYRRITFFTPRHREIIEAVCCEYGKERHSVAELSRIAADMFQRNGLGPIGLGRFTKEYKEIMKNQKCVVDGWTEDEISWFTSLFQEGEEPTEEELAVPPPEEA